MWLEEQGNNNLQCILLKTLSHGQTQQYSKRENSPCFQYFFLLFSLFFTLVLLNSSFWGVLNNGRYGIRDVKKKKKHHQCNSLNVSCLDSTRSELLLYRSCLRGTDVAFSTICERPCRRCPAVFTRGLRTPGAGCSWEIYSFTLSSSPSSSSSSPSSLLFLRLTVTPETTHWGGGAGLFAPSCHIRCCRIFAGATVYFSFDTLHLPGGQPELMEVHPQSGAFMASLLGKTLSLSNRDR